MENEELMWKLSETLSFHESDIGAQEALFYQKLGMSPTSTRELESPLLGRKLRTPSSSEASPSKSPGYRRTLSSSNDDREEKKLKRRSGNFLLDERKQQQVRPTSPLAKQNPMTRSWSPSTLSSSPTRTNGRTGSKMSQSWCVDLEAVDMPPEPDTIPRSMSTSGRPSSRKLVKHDVNSAENSDSDKGFVSTDNSYNSSVELSESLKSNGVLDNSDSVPKSSTPRSGRETVTLSKSDDVFSEDEKDKKCVDSVGNLAQKPAETSRSRSPERTGIRSKPSKETTPSPLSKLPVHKDRKDSPSKRSHTETTV